MTHGNYTPGLWHRDCFNVSSIIRLQYPVGHPNCKHITGTYETIARCEGENWDANSLLVATAPELVEALDHLLEQVDEDCPNTYRTAHLIAAMNTARAAINKAKGTTV